eukprot:1156945-Pelagomonas_calceolata.AAC.2
MAFETFDEGSGVKNAALQHVAGGIDASTLPLGAGWPDQMKHDGAGLAQVGVSRRFSMLTGVGNYLIKHSVSLTKMVMDSTWMHVPPPSPFTHIHTPMHAHSRMHRSLKAAAKSSRRSRHHFDPILALDPNHPGYLTPSSPPLGEVLSSSAPRQGVEREGGRPRLRGGRHTRSGSADRAGKCGMYGLRSRREVQRANVEVAGVHASMHAVALLAAWASVEIMMEEAGGKFKECRLWVGRHASFGSAVRSKVARL